MRTGRPRSFDRAKALEIAMELFWRKGFEGTSKRDLMEATGIGSQSLYNAFGDKRALFQEAVQQYAQCAIIEAEEQLSAGSTPLESVKAFVRAWAEDTKGCLCANTAGELGTKDPEMMGILHAQMGRAVDAFANALRRAQEQGELSPEANPQQLAMALFAVRGGLALMIRSGVPKDALDKAVEGALSLLRPH